MKERPGCSAYKKFLPILILAGIAITLTSTGCSTPYRNPAGHQVMDVDQDIQRIIYTRLQSDPVTATQGFGVEVQNGVVTLYGATSSTSARMAAVNIAGGVSGVRQVISRIRSW